MLRFLVDFSSLELVSSSWKTNWTSSLKSINKTSTTLNLQKSNKSDSAAPDAEGRAGQKGHAVTLIVDRDAHALRGIVEVKLGGVEVKPKKKQPET